MTHNLRTLSPRRIALLASAAGLGAAILFSGATVGLYQNGISPATAVAQTAQRPVGFADIVEKVKPAVISVRVKLDPGARMMGLEGNSPFGPNSPMERFFRRFGLPEGTQPDERPAPRNRLVTGQGSGFFITADGYAVTNNHVVDKADTVEITTDDGKTYGAKVIGTDPRTDVALIKAEGRSDFPFVKLSDQSPRIGDWVLAVGNPFGLGGTVTAGIVSARGRDIGAGPYDDFIQIDAPVNKGNSGGPTFDVDGNVIGVNTAIFSPSGGSVGIAFAIPASTVKSVVAQLKDKGSVTRGWIGVQIQPVTSEIAESIGLKKAEGALVSDPQANGPAAKAGVEAGDVITAVNGTTVKDARDLAKQIGSIAPNTPVNLTVWHKGTEKSVALTLGELPNQREARATASEHLAPNGGEVPRLGLTLAPAGQVAGSGSEGVVVTKVDPDGVASEHGFQTGDVILEVGGKKVAHPSDVRSALNEAQKGGKRSVLMRVKSGETTKFVALPLGRA
ncbi:MAG TPA: Do family serine endopeptidase [Xanthobacteraceae bacterium]|jgi:serine protease Do